MIDRCRTSEGIFIPECWGGVHYGRSGCDCPPRDRDDEIQKLEKRVARLEMLCATLQNREKDNG